MPASDAPVVIEVALNGATRPEQNPHVPTTQRELARDALRCIEAGASIVHTHAPDLRAQGADAAALYLEHFRPVLAQHPDAILYPTLVFADAIEQKNSHIAPLVEGCGLRMGFADPGSVNLAPTDERGVPLPVEWVYANSFRDIAWQFDLCERLGLGPGIAIFEPGFLRAVLAYHRAGRLPRGAFVRLYLGGESSYRGGDAVDLLFGLPPRTSSLDVYVDMLRGTGLPWCAAVLSGDVVETGIARHAIELGGHVRVGLEDYAGPRCPSNVELVQEVAALCRSLGRRAARPDETAKILSLPR